MRQTLGPAVLKPHICWGARFRTGGGVGWYEVAALGG